MCGCFCMVVMVRVFETLGGGFERGMRDGMWSFGVLKY